MNRAIIIILLLLSFLPAGLSAGRKVYATASSFKSALSVAIAGDTIELADGAYDIGGNSLTKSGTADQRIVIKAQNRGKAELKGSSAFTGKGIAFVTIEGFLFTSSATTVVKTESCNNMRITRNVFRLTETASGKWVLIGGTYNIATANSHHNRIDHNRFEGKTQLGNYVTIDGSPSSLGSPEASTDDRIDHNHFRTIGPRATNEMETIRIGQSEICRSESRTVVEENLFEECDGDPEIVSVKTKKSVIRWNTFVRSQGTVCLRSSDSSLVEGNWFFGGGKSGTGGVRVYGQGHRIINNYFHALTGDTWDAPITITNGDAELSGSNTAHWRPTNITVAFNTFVENDQGLQFGFTNNGSYGKAPQNITAANNLVVGAKNQLVKVITAPSNLVWQGNIMYPRSGATLGITATDAQVKVIDPQLTGTDSLYRIAAGSPAVDAAIGPWSAVGTDIDGQQRAGVWDVGADEVSSSQALHRPLTTTDVGPDAPESLAVVTAVGEKRNRGTSLLPGTSVMNYPNPFNPSTTIVAVPAFSGWSTIRITDMTGRAVGTVFQGRVEAGREVRVPFRGDELSSGVYLLSVETAGDRIVRRMILLR